jgi:N-acetylneuraminate lyase/4-hydroxy-tetrahydrodipicolinate synthase
MKKQIKGIIPPLTTPFTLEGSVYEEGLKTLLDFQISGGVHGLFICGTYGSGPIMSFEERQQTAEIIVNHVKGKIPVIVHVGTTSTVQSIELAQHASEIGADVVASVPPYYHHHDERSIKKYFDSLVQSVDIPVFVYNNPKTTGFSITPKFLSELAELGIQGIKDSCFSFVEFSHFLLALGNHPDFTFIIGTEALCLAAMMVGAKGCVAGLANVFPELVVSLYDAISASNFKEAAPLQMRVNRARQILHIPSSTNAACYFVLKHRGIDVGIPKEPILPVLDSDGKAMIEQYKEMELL